MNAATDNAFYRVSVKALIFDGQNRILLFQARDGRWELPGGGLEHGETLEQGLTRELYEEMRVVPASIGDIRFVFTGKSSEGFYKLRIVMPVTLTHYNFTPSDDDLAEARFVTREEFLALSFNGSEHTVQACVDQIWR